ncbi:DNA polymerase III subunit delta' [Treponema primitia]|uniref:DNA polymerase III subunit delta' n=1 Tax=Treponema primitia TaxID=88058 RepID=UPI0002555787|nr:DNA polymerase III [Treponema primitia]
MFENVLGQPVISLLSSDISGGILAPSMLFSGPQASGKGSAALELGRVLSCEQTGAWNCSCPACARHRQLTHPDLLLLGPRNFSAEIAASAAAFLRDPPVPATRFLFIRSVRKLLARFSPVLWEDDPKISKLNPLIQSLDENLDELDAVDPEALTKTVDSILKISFKLEAEGIGDRISVAQVRRAAWWSRLAPQGKRKLLVIENADHMQDGARNSLLKILEEPPERVTIVLSTAHYEALLPTILSRVRPYRFIARDKTVEAQVLRKIFRDPREQVDSISLYLDSFLPVSGETLYPLGALFVASVAMGSVITLKRSGAPLNDPLVSLGKYTAPIAEAAGLGRPLEDTKSLVSKVLEGADNFELRSRFSQFLQSLLTLIGESLNARETSLQVAGDPGALAYRDIWRAAVREAESAVGTYNLSPALALDRLASELKRGMVSHGSPRLMETY